MLPTALRSPDVRSGVLGCFPRAPLGNKQRTNVGLLEPTYNSVGHELGAAGTDAARWSAPQMFRPAADRKQVLQDTDDVSGRKRTGHFDRQAFPCVLVDHDEQLQLTTIFGPI